MPWPPPSLPSLTVVTDITQQRTQHANDHNALAVVTNGMLATAWVLVNPSGGAAPAFVSPWVNYSPGIGSGWQVVRFRKELGDICRIEGVCASGASGATIFTLPLGFRPPQNINLACNMAGSTNGLGFISVLPTGVVYASYGTGQTGTVTAVHLNCSFVIDPASL